MSVSHTGTGAVGEPSTAAHQRRARSSARRHTRLVKTLRVLLPLSGVAIVIVLFGSALLKSLVPLNSIGNIDVTSEGLVMNDPNLAGRLNDGRAYKVSAAKAVQSFSDTSRISLTDLLATLNLGDDQTVEVNSRSGVFDTDEEWMTLSDGIVLTTTDGYRVDLSTARIDFKNSSMVSDNKVKIVSKTFDLTADAVKILDEGKVVRFVGNVHTTIHGKPESQ